jgi:hypothetical protein
MTKRGVCLKETTVTSYLVEQKHICHLHGLSDLLRDTKEKIKYRRNFDLNERSDDMSRMILEFGFM